jgi:hypothetical protein
VQASITPLVPLERKRPLGVWVFSSLNIVSAVLGLIGALLSVLVFLGGGTVPWRTPFDIFVGVPYHLVSIGLTVGLWLGHNKSRILFLWVVSGYYCLAILSVVYRAVADPRTSGEATLGGILGALLWMLVFLWYFRRPRIVAFYG